MSLRSTFTNASINGWSAKGGQSYVNPQVIPFYEYPPANQTNFQLAMSGDGSTIATRWHGNSGGGFLSPITVYVKDSNGQWQFDALVNSGTIVPPIDPPLSAAWIDLSYDGTTLAVGGTDTGITNGEAYIYIRTSGTWSWQATLTASDAPKPTFGIGISISDDGNNVIVGCPKESTTNYGSAYIFTRSGSTWTEQQKIVAGDQVTNDYFGTSVSMSADGTKVAVGAPQGGLQASTTYGKAYIFTKSGSTWTQQQKITAPTLTTLRNFGQRMRISGDGNTILVGGTGATDAQTSPTYTGKNVYVFYYNGSTWTNTQTISSLAGTYGFGSDMSTTYNGSIIYIGQGVRISPYSGSDNIIIDSTDSLKTYIGSSGVYVESTTITPTKQNVYEIGIGMYSACSHTGDFLVTDSCGINGGAPSDTTYLYCYTIT